MESTRARRSVGVFSNHTEGRVGHTSIELSLALGESLRVLCVYEENDTGDLGKVLLRPCQPL